MKRWVFAAALLVLPSSFALADPSREAVEHLLAGYEPHSSIADLKKLGNGTDRVLIAVASDARVSRLRRGRALHALGYVPSLEGRDFLRATLRERRASSESPDLLDLKACLRALGRFGSDAAADILPLLTHPTGDVREAAARALADTGSAAARPALEQRFLAEREPSVRAALQELLSAAP